MRPITLMALALLWGTAALGMDIQGVRLPDTASVGGRQLVLNGAGVRTKVVFRIYVGSLYLPQATRDAAAALAAAPRRVRLDLLRNLHADQLSDALIEGLKDNNSDAELAAVKAQTDQMVAVMKGFGDVKEGSIVALDHFDGATHILLDGNERAAIAGEAFAQALARIWLGDHPVQADLKRAMLGGGGS